jgi:hypothetical protein
MRIVRLTVVLLMGLLLGLFTAAPTPDPLDTTYDETDSQPFESSASVTVPKPSAPLQFPHSFLKATAQSVADTSHLPSLPARKARANPLPILNLSLRC